MDSPSITQQTLRELESLATPLSDSWYFITAVALCSLGQDHAVREVFQYACHDAKVADSEHSRRSQRIRDALIKAIPAIGMPKVLNSLQILGSAEDRLLGPNAPVSNRASEWISAPSASFMERGEAYATRLHGDDRVLDRLDDYGTADLAFVVRLCYGSILSDVTILDAADTSLAFLAALITQDVHPQIEAHSRGAVRNSATVGQVEATTQLVETVCRLVHESSSPLARKQEEVNDVGLSTSPGE